MSQFAAAAARASVQCRGATSRAVARASNSGAARPLWTFGGRAGRRTTNQATSPVATRAPTAGPTPRRSSPPVTYRSASPAKDSNPESTMTDVAAARSAPPARNWRKA
ncbi:hypothetical protein GCM10027258_00470 [Amycolatopsis stemonae]